MSYKEGGWEEKYVIQKRQLDTCKGCVKESCLGCIYLKPVDKNAVYFVLRLDTDIHARKAAFAYARSVQLENPQFAKDIRTKVLGLFEKNMRKGSEKENA